MSVEFTLGHNDHIKAEDFLASRPAGVGAVTLHPTAAKHQLGVAEAARDAGMDVLFEPRTEYLAYPDPGEATRKLPGWTGEVLDISRLTRNQSERDRLVASVLDAHPDETTLVTPPSFLIEDARHGHLNVALAEAARLATDKPVRARVLLASRVTVATMDEIAGEYRDAGISQVDLRITPLTGENDGIRKINMIFLTADLFRDAGITVTLGNSGNVGRVAYALGRVDAYSIGIGENEHVDHAGRVRRQVSPPPARFDENGRRLGGGGWEGIYLPGLAATVSRKVGETLLGHTDIRTRIGCRIGACADSIAGPLQDHKTHYMHARAAEMAELVAKPAPWRVPIELDRIQRAFDLRRLVNEQYRGNGQPELKTRTLSSLIEGIQQARAA